jgi:hypothetical protein
VYHTQGDVHPDVGPYYPGAQPIQEGLDPIAVQAGAGAVQVSTEESSRDAVAAVLHTVTSLVGAVLAAGSLGEAQAAVFAEGGGLIETIMGLH